MIFRLLTSLGLLLSAPLVHAAGEKEGQKPETPKKSDAPQKPESPKKPDAPKKVSKGEAEEQKRLDGYFEGFDKDKDGKLSIAEFRAAYRSGSMGEGSRLFKEMDRDADQALSREEFGKFKSERFMSKNEKDALEGRDWKKEREKRERDRKR